MPFDEGAIDGSLRNPVVVGAVLLWALALLLACLVSLRVFGRSRFAGAAVAAVLVVGWLLGPFILTALVNGLYRVTASPSVGLVGRPPAWAAPLIAGVGAFVANAVARKRRGAPAGDAPR